MTNNRTLLNQTDDCLNLFFFQLHQNSLVNFTAYNFTDFNPNRIRLPIYEFVIKVFLCSISIIASLSGNLIVIYSILVKSNSKANFYNVDLKITSSVNLNQKKTFQNIELDNNLSTVNHDHHIQHHHSLNLHNHQTHSNSHSHNSRKTLSLPHRHDLHDLSKNMSMTELEQMRVEKKFLVTQIYKPYKNKPVNLFILNLCFCDLMIVVWCSWVHMVNSISENWVMGSFFCKFNTYVQVMSLIAAISTLSLISFERFKGIVFTLAKKMDKKNSINMIIFIWLFSMIAAIPIFIYRKQYTRIWNDRVEIYCADAWPKQYTYKKNTKCIDTVEEPLRKIYYTFISFVLFFIPIAIMLFCYCLIIRKLNNTKILGYLNDNSSGKSLLNKRRQKVNILLIGLLISFVLCWSPVQVLILYEAHKQKIDEMPGWFNWVYFLVYLLAYSNSAINPVIYTGVNKLYRKELRKIINTFVGKRRNLSANSHLICSGTNLKNQKIVDSYG